HCDRCADARQNAGADLAQHRHGALPEPRRLFLQDLGNPGPPGLQCRWQRNVTQRIRFQRLRKLTGQGGRLLPDFAAQRNQNRERDANERQVDDRQRQRPRHAARHEPLEPFHQRRQQVSQKNCQRKNNQRVPHAVHQPDQECKQEHRPRSPQCAQVEPEHGYQNSVTQRTHSCVPRPDSLRRYFWQRLFSSQTGPSSDHVRCSFIWNSCDHGRLKIFGSSIVISYRSLRRRPLRGLDDSCSITMEWMTQTPGGRMRGLVAGLQDLEDKLKAGGGARKIEKQHGEGKLTARERIAHLIDPGAMFLEIGLLIAYDRYEGQAPAAGVVTGLGHIEKRPAVIVANDATVKAGAWWPETIHKILRAQEIAMRNRLPIVYLVDSAGVNLPYQDGIFPGQYGAARIFYYNSLMRRRLKVPQIAAVMGMCIAGGAYLPALSDVIFMVDGSSFMGLGGPNLVKGAVGQSVDAETLGGARMHTTVSGVAHYLAASDRHCLELIRRKFRELPQPEAGPKGTAPAKSAEGLYDLLPSDHRLPYDVQEVIDRIVDNDDTLEFQPDHAPEMLCTECRLAG